MSNLITTSFRDQNHAIEALSDLKRRRRDCISDLDQAVIVSLENGGRASLRFDANQLTADGTTFTELSRSLLSAAFALPLTAFSMQPFDVVSQIAGTDNPIFSRTEIFPTPIGGKSTSERVFCVRLGLS